MEIIVRNLHDQITERQVDNFFKGVLEKLDIHTYHIQKLRSRGCATITIHDLSKASLFLRLHGQTQPGAKGFATVSRKLVHMGRQINCSVSNHPLDPYLLQSLKKQESQRYAASQSTKPAIVPGVVPSKSSKNQRAFDVRSLDCGQWTYVGEDLAFVPYFQERRTSRMVFGPRSLMIKITPHHPTMPSPQVEILYDNIHSVTVGQKSSPTVAFDLSQAPRFFERLPPQSADPMDSTLELLVQSLSLRKSNQEITRKRTTALSKAHETVVSSCLCYRVMLVNSGDLTGIQALKRFAEIPDSMVWNTSTVIRTPFVSQISRLNMALAGAKYTKLPFIIKFQLQKLAQNGYLEPSKVEELLPIVASQLQTDHSAATVAESIRNLGGYLPFAGPETEAVELSIQTLSKYLARNQESIVRGESYANGFAEQYDHIASVHKATITPAGVYLYGPDPEIKNRVLRRYSAFLDYFLSVSFLDEDGEPLRLDRKTSGKEIYHGRFKNILQFGISIAGRQYEVGL